MYGSIGNFVKAIILEFLTIFLFVNIVFAFNLYSTIGVPNTAMGVGSFGDDVPVFAVSSFIDAFNAYFGQSDLNNFFKGIMDGLLKATKTLDISRVFKLDNFNTSLGGNRDASSLLKGLITLVNLFLNIPYIFLTVLYLTLFLVYVIMLVIEFVIFIFYLLAGFYYRARTDTYGIYTNLLLTRLTF